MESPPLILVRVPSMAEHLGHPAELGPDSLHQFFRYREGDRQIGCHRLPHRNLLGQPINLSDH
jgi:hypothetical protein